MVSVWIKTLEYCIDNLTGDVDMNDCIGKAGFITPVPGGVALLTTAMLMANTLKAFIYQERLTDIYNKITDCPLVNDNHFAYKSFM